MLEVGPVELEPMGWIIMTVFEHMVVILMVEWLKAKVKACLEEEARQEETEAVAEHYEWVPHVKTMHLPTALQD
jgi:hypothetical protein